MRCSGKYNKLALSTGIIQEQSDIFTEKEIMQSLQVLLKG